MWYSSRGENDGRRVQPWMVTSSYLHWDIGYGIPSQINRAQDVQRTSITPGHHRHVKHNIKGGVQCLEKLISPQRYSFHSSFPPPPIDSLWDKDTFHIVRYVRYVECLAIIYSLSNKRCDCFE